MSTETNRALVRRWYGLIDSDPAAAGAMFAPDARVWFAGAPGPLDPPAFAQFGQGFFAAFPDLRHTIEDMVAEGDEVAVRLTLRGTHRADLMGVPATGRAIIAPSLTIVRLRDGMITHAWISVDTLGLLRQIGAIPATTAA